MATNAQLVEQMDKAHVNDPLRVERDLPDLDPLPIYVHVDGLTKNVASKHLEFAMLAMKMFDSRTNISDQMLKGLLSATVKLGVVDRFFPKMVDRDFYKRIIAAIHTIIRRMSSAE